MQKKNKDSLVFKSLKSEEKSMETFINNFEKIETFNKNPNETYKQGITDDADQTFEERKKSRSGAKPPKGKRTPYLMSSPVGSNITAPNSGLMNA